MLCSSRCTFVVLLGFVGYATLGTASASAQSPSRTPESSGQQSPSDGAQSEASSEELMALGKPGGLTADQAVERAVASAPTLERSAAAVRAAEAGARRAWQAFFPQLEVSARYTRLSPIDQPSFGGALIDEESLPAARALVAAVDDPEAQQLWSSLIDAFGNSEAFEFPVILNQYLIRATGTVPVSDYFLTILPNYRAAQALVTVGEAQAQAERAQVAFRARETYYQLARARSAQVIANKAVEQAQAHRARMARLVEGGAAARVDLMRLDAQRAQSEVLAVRARSGARIAERALQLLMHEDAPITLAGDLSVDPSARVPAVDAMTQRALRQREELQTLRALVAAREARTRATLGRRWPQLFVQGNVDIANPNQRIIPQVEEFRATWDVSVVLRWSPNEMGDARAAAAEARAQLEQARADMSGLTDAVRLEVEEAHATVEASRLAYEAARLGLTAAEEQHRVRQAQLEAGAVVTSDLLDAEADLTRARLQWVDAAIDHQVSRARLDRSVGAAR